MKTDLSEYFYDGQWKEGSGESVSGPGSSLQYTAAFRPMLEGLLQHLGVRRFVDAPCGDFNWMREVNLTGIHYLGYDIVPEIVERNKALYGSPAISFDVGDITEMTLPEADLMMCRDCLFHFPYAFIFKFFENFTQSDISYLLTTSHTHNRRNKDLETPGKFRFLNLRRPPFRMPEPEAMLPDYMRDSARTRPRAMLLWNRQAIAEWLARRDGNKE